MIAPANDIAHRTTTMNTRQTDSHSLPKYTRLAGFLSPPIRSSVSSLSQIFGVRSWTHFSAFRPRRSWIGLGHCSFSSDLDIQVVGCLAREVYRRIGVGRFHFPFVARCIQVVEGRCLEGACRFSVSVWTHCWFGVRCSLFGGIMLGVQRSLVLLLWRRYPGFFTSI